MKNFRKIRKPCQISNFIFQVDQKLLFYNLGTWFQNVYGNNPMELVRMVKKVLSVEQMIIQNATQAQQGESKDDS